MKIILLGAPNSGKGTLSGNIKDKYNLIQVSTGDLLRAEVVTGSELGKKIHEVQMSGGMVEFQTVLDVMNKFLASVPEDKGLLFDGFPRDLRQAEALSNITKIDAVLLLDVEVEEILKRALGRLTCSSCKSVTNREYVDSDICPKCGGKLETRADDNEETVRKRIKTYFDSTYPLIEYYSKLGLLHKIDAGHTPEYTMEQAIEILSRLK